MVKDNVTRAPTSAQPQITSSASALPIPTSRQRSAWPLEGKIMEKDNNETESWVPFRHGNNAPTILVTNITRQDRSLCVAQLVDSFHGSSATNPSLAVKEYVLILLGRFKGSVLLLEVLHIKGESLRYFSHCRGVITMIVLPEYTIQGCDTQLHALGGAYK